MSSDLTLFTVSVACDCTCCSHFQTLSLQPSTVSELHVEDTEDDTDGTDCDAAGEANTRKHAKRAKTSTSRSTKGRQRAGNQNRKQVHTYVCVYGSGVWGEMCTYIHRG